nr:integrase, catalytic region, zinc finger, CCHC-type, peptidase aspartic, catalytic [Tanacetum cinerariifolium]
MANLLEDIQCAGSDTRPPMLDRTDFASWQQCIRLYCRDKENGVNILKLIDEGAFQMGIVREILAEGTEGALHLESKRTIHAYYVRFAKLINDMRNIKMTMSRMQLNSKFVNNMLPEWGRFVTTVKLNRGLRDSNYDQLGQGNKPWDGGAAGYEEAQKRVGNANPGGQDNAIDEDVDEQPVQDLALKVDNVFQADNYDTFDSDVDEAPTAQTMFMTNLSFAGPVYDEAGPSYDLDILSEIFFEELEVEVTQNVIDRKHDEIERKNLLIANDNLIAECFSKEVFYVATNSKLNVSRFTEMHVAHTIVEARCLELEDELSNLRDKIHNDNHNELVNRFSNLEDHVKPTVLAPGKYVIDIKPIPPRLRNNRKVHLDYLRHLKESVETIREIELLEYAIGTFSQDSHQRDKKHAPAPLIKKKQVTFEEQCDTSNSNTHKLVAKLNTQKTNVLVPPSIGVNSCTDASGSQTRSHTKKNRISPAKGVNKMKVEAHPRTNKPHLRTTNRVDSSSRSKHTVVQIVLWYLDLTCSKHMTGDCSRLMNFMKKFIGTVRFGNDHFGVIIGYGDYVIGDSVISRVYYVEGLGHYLFSVRQFCDSDLEVAFRKHSCYVRDTNGVEVIKALAGLICTLFRLKT